MKTKPILKRSVGTFGTLRFDEKSFFSTSLNFSPYWIYKQTNAFHAGSPGVYTSEKNEIQVQLIKLIQNVMLWTAF